MLLSLVGIDKSNLSSARVNMMKVRRSVYTDSVVMLQCEVVVKEYWRDFYPHLANSVSMATP